MTNHVNIIIARFSSIHNAIIVQCFHTLPIGVAIKFGYFARCLGNWFIANYRRYCFWHFLVYDSPQQHPRISDDEKNYILDNITGSVEDEEKTQIPWRSIILSRPVWVTIAAHWGTAWGFFTLMTQAPTYFNFIHGWNINAVSFAWFYRA